ncbi:NHLP bacteriocin system secretion protein [Roseibium sp. MMSF_3544]|uniref:NHLP bacteriocin system secretion protein n=1 Tax=unclassified Roseibium TaxID=2629323 RepID=UPI00273D343A|nr:NHLP bacteriocin system secretion protein [Roseibium sp. MMSF_3544]
MTKQIYRQAALDRLSSPEQLDRPYSLVSAGAWISLLILIACILLAFVWALFADAPVKVSGGGILLQQQGLNEVSSEAAGRIDRLNLAVGDYVEKDQVIARFNRTRLKLELANAEAALEDSQQRLASLVAFSQEQEELKSNVRNSRIAGLDQVEKMMIRRKELLESRVDSIAALVEKQLTTPASLIAVELELANARERLLGLENERRSMRSSFLEEKVERDLALLDENLKIEQQIRSIERMKRRLNLEQAITSPHSGQVLEVRVNEGDVIDAGEAIATLAVEMPGDELETEALIYVSSVDGKKIKPGMLAEVVPSLFKKSRYGFIRGHVVYVSALPASFESIRTNLRNERLAQELSGGSSSFEVRVRLERDPSTVSGLSWSSSQGPDDEIRPGTLLTAAFVVAREPVADIAMPGLADRLQALWKD